jgi:hypothetical protein
MDWERSDDAVNIETVRNRVYLTGVVPTAKKSNEPPNSPSRSSVC